MDHFSLDDFKLNQNRRFAAVLDRLHRQSCDEVGDHPDEVDTCFSVGAGAIRMVEFTTRGQRELAERERNARITQTPAIDWTLLAKAMTYYQGNGYQEVQVPWIVNLNVNRITCLDERRIMAVPGHGGLVGSAEQSFLALDLAGKLGKGKFVAITPCFRDEVEDALHQKTFMKVELYRNDVTDHAALEQMITDARLFFMLMSGMSVDRVKTDDGFDLNLNGIEIGSYGIRETSRHRWVYGTGLAEPRFTTARG